jgi:hypothetical protein
MRTFRRKCVKPHPTKDGHSRWPSNVESDVRGYSVLARF